ncbi:flavodoxin family protein [Paractinoplanes atraurantiacus]|uniref:Flavodoxin n=1 Tax=Paractinoplanes atraurantiacus TaxID=1036182 RepID=A0A285JVA8_9ACTN|nr:flavodoxin domain-containing protein [Actinoplanes atraurantiacus]SNY64208.1 Flavodoxin [Actinoplanes atraurantiacus]
MKALVVYESLFGNTEAIARAIADGLGDAFEVRLAEAREIPSADGADLLIAGAPTHAFGLSRPGTRKDAARQGEVRPGTADVGLREYLDVSPALPGLAAATFDTRINKTFVPGSAAHKAHRRLRRLGCRMVRGPESFRVEGTTGPLVAGELERARNWASGIAADWSPVVTAEGQRRR